MAIKVLPSVGELKELFNYNESTGDLTWRPRTAERCGHVNTAKYFNDNHAGNKVGYKNKRGYLELTMGPKYYLCHRIIWKWMTGEEPPAVIDHINQVTDDNRWVNLRASDSSQNVANSKLRKRTHPRGVYPNADGTYTARTRVTKTLDLGTYSTALEAEQAYKKYRNV